MSIGFTVKTIILNRILYYTESPRLCISCVEPSLLSSGQATGSCIPGGQSGRSVKLYLHSTHGVVRSQATGTALPVPYSQSRQVRKLDLYRTVSRLKCACSTFITQSVASSAQARPLPYSQSPQVRMLDLYHTVSRLKCACSTFITQSVASSAHARPLSYSQSPQARMLDNPAAFCRRPAIGPHRSPFLRSSHCHRQSNSPVTCPGRPVWRQGPAAGCRQSSRFLCLPSRPCHRQSPGWPRDRQQRRK
jgi:hypothetical protein